MAKKTLLDKTIEEMIPFIENDFLTFPLSEEGNYSPQFNFWLIFEKLKITKENIEEIQNNIGIPENYYLDFLIDEIEGKNISLEDFISIMDGKPLPEFKTSNKPPRYLYHFSLWCQDENIIDINKLATLTLKAFKYLNNLRE